jgi:protein SERAC1
LKIALLFGMTKSSDVKDLEERSERLMRINRDFDIFVKGRDRDNTLKKVEIVCYFEEFPTYITGKDIDKIVKKESAARLSAITTLGIPANHSNMYKFAADFVSGYVSVSGQLAQWIKQLEKTPNEDAVVRPSHNPVASS